MLKSTCLGHPEKTEMTPPQKNVYLLENIVKIVGRKITESRDIKIVM